MTERSVLTRQVLTRRFVALSDAIAAKDDARMAVEFENVIPVFQQLGEAAKEVTK